MPNEGETLEEEINEFKRMVNYTEGGERSLRIKLKSQTAATEVFRRTGKLKKTNHKTVWICEDVNGKKRVNEVSCQ